MTKRSIVFDRAASFYDNTRGFPDDVAGDVAALMVRQGQFTSTSRIIEVGVGTGRMALPLAAHVRSVQGIDLSIKMMRRLVEKRTTESLYVAQADAGHLPYPNRSFDGGVVAHVFHLVADPDRVVEELARVIRPSGKLLHCWNGHEDRFYALRHAWVDALGDDRRGDRWQRARTILHEHNWNKTGETVHQYSTMRTPLDVLNEFRNRTWSGTWHLTDDEIKKGAAAIERAIGRLYGNPVTPVEVINHFHIRVYEPPSG